MNVNKQQYSLLYLLFFLSGIPALIYQTVWQRALFSIYGTNIQSITIIVAIFLFGLGLGALIGGYISKVKAGNLLGVFGILELSIGIIGFFSLNILFWIGKHTLSLNLTAVSLVVFLLLLLPTIMMGASLPLLVAYLTRRLPNVTVSVGSLYSANTFGAAFACFVVSVLFMRYLGQANTVIIAALINCVVGSSALALRSSSYFAVIPSQRVIPAAIPASKNPAVTNNGHFFLILLVAALTGYIALSYEILWVHVYAFATGGHGPDFPMYLGYYLSGIAFGSYIIAKCFAATKANKVNYKLLVVVLLISAVMCYLVIPGLTFVVVHANNFAMLILIGIASTMFGLIFPLLSNYFVPVNENSGRMMGLFYFANILGSILGILLTGFVLMNIWSIAVLAKFLLLIALLTACLPLLLTKISFGRTVAIMASVCVMLQASPLILFHHSYEKLLFKSHYNSKDEFKYVVENNAGTIAVTHEDAVFGGGVYDGYFNFDPMHNVNWIWRAYAIPLFVPQPKNVLMIGLSSGSWAQVIANNPEVKHLTIVEINPGYLELISKFPENVSLLHNPKVSIVIDDGRRWLLRNKTKKYDLIVMNTSFHWRAYITFLLSTNFMQVIKEHLTASGVFYFNTTNSHDVAKTILHEFSSVWSLQNFILASNKPIKLDRTNLKRVLLDYKINGRKVFDLSKQADQSTLKQIVALPETHMLNRTALEELTADAGIITDDNMLTEWNRAI